MTEFTGSLRERVEVHRWQPARSDSGGNAGYWVAGETVAAAIVPTDSNASPVIGERLASRPRFRLTLRRRPGITLATRFRWRGRLLSILRLEADPRTPDRLTCLVEDRT